MLTSLFRKKIMEQGGNSQNFLRKFVRFSELLDAFTKQLSIKNKQLMFFTGVNIDLLISASKTTFSHYNFKILRPKVRKNLINFRKKFCEFPPITQLYYVSQGLRLNLEKIKMLDNCFKIIFAPFFSGGGGFISKYWFKPKITTLCQVELNQIFILYCQCI